MATAPAGRDATGGAPLAPGTIPSIGAPGTAATGMAVGRGVGVGRVQTTLTLTALVRAPTVTVIWARPGLTGAVKIAVALPPFVIRSGVIMPIDVLKVAVVPLSTWRPALSVIRAMIWTALPQGTPAAGTRKDIWAATPAAGVGSAPNAIDGRTRNVSRTSTS